MTEQEKAEILAELEQRFDKKYKGCLTREDTQNELKPCEYCKELPELQKGVELSFQERFRFRFRCPRCNIVSKSCYTIEGAIEVWNRGTDNEKV